MIDFLSTLLNQQHIAQSRGKHKYFSWQYMAEGILECTPHDSYDLAVVLSAGIHGNETAPIELLDRLVTDLFEGRLKLSAKVLFILGNPVAIRHKKRYVDYDLNRLFCGAHKNLADVVESSRAKILETAIHNFFERCNHRIKRYHYDMHTAIRASKFPTFALLPYQTREYDPELKTSLEAANLDALVYHSSSSSTFTHFTSAYHSAASVTLELGKAQPFGENNLAQFTAIDTVIRTLITGYSAPKRIKAQLEVFKVTKSLIKKNDTFQINLPDDAPNFSHFVQGEIIASDSTSCYKVEESEVWILFPNPNVQVGLRAGLILEKHQPSPIKSTLSQNDHDS